MHKEKTDKVPKDDPLPNHPFAILGFGEVLLLVSLALDGLTGAVQDKMNATHEKKSHHKKVHTMMYNMNLWSCILLFLAILVTGEVFEYFIFAQKYPQVIWYMILLSICGCIGQHFIFTTITTFGPLACSIITTSRKFFTILGSVFLFGNALSPMQWIGSTLVFIGLALDSKFGKETHKVKG
jgi:solute carrier family 35 (UDP-galactose transporter), member B1